MCYVRSYPSSFVFTPHFTSGRRFCVILPALEANLHTGGWGNGGGWGPDPTGWSNGGGWGPNPTDWGNGVGWGAEDDQRVYLLHDDPLRLSLHQDTR
jgi:hypothetical protein